MYEQEAMRRETKELLQGGASASDPAPSLSFMYALPPGLAEAQAKKKPVPTEEMTHFARHLNSYLKDVNKLAKTHIILMIPILHLVCPQQIGCGSAVG